MEKSSPVLFDFPNRRLNVFLMMRFSDTPQNREILDTLNRALAHYGLNALRADQKTYSVSLWENVKAYLDACEYGIAVFEQVDDKNFNPNVSLEVGYLYAQGKPVLLLKEQRLPALPTDIVGHLYKTFDIFAIRQSIERRVEEWLRDVGIAKGPGEKLIVFVSHAGTCRCAMAKIATQRALADRVLPFRLRVESVAHSFGGANESSRTARRAVFEQYGRDLLQEHRVIRRNPGILQDADLILVMEQELRSEMPEAKTFLFSEFFGSTGDIPNPWPAEETEAAQERYRECLRLIRTTIEGGTGRILSYLNEVTFERRVS